MKSLVLHFSSKGWTLRIVYIKFEEKSLGFFKIVLIVRIYIVVHNTSIGLEYVQPQTKEPYE